MGLGGLGGLGGSLGGLGFRLSLHLEISRASAGSCVELVSQTSV